MFENALLFVHIPKTAGTSFLKSCEAYLGKENIFYDYGAQSPVTNQIIKDRVYQEQDLYTLLQSEIAQDFTTILAGHFHINKYAPLFKAQNIITFMRDPVQQVISHYEHHKRDLDYKKNLEDFCKEDRFTNLQSRVLQNYPLEAIGFVGTTERYSESLKHINNIWSLDLMDQKLNFNSEKEGLTYNPHQKIRELITDRNQADIKLYQRANELLDIRLQYKDSSQNYVYGCITDINKTTINGWCFKSNSEEPVELEIIENGKIIDTIKSVQFRGRFKQLNSPRNGFIGFHINVNNINPALIELKVKHTNQRIQIGI